MDEIARDGLQAVDEMLDADEGLSREDRDKDGTTKTTYDSDFIFTSRDAGADTDDEASDEKAALDGAGGGRAWEKVRCEHACELLVYLTELAPPAFRQGPLCESGRTWVGLRPRLVGSRRSSEPE